MEFVQLLAQLGQVALVDHPVQQFVALVARQFLPVGDRFHQRMLVQQVLYLQELILHIFGVMTFVVGLIHGTQSCELQC